MSIPTDEKILEYAKVPVTVAAKYLDCNPDLIRAAIENRSCPFAFYAQGKGRRAFHISPGMLVAYKRGNLVLQLDTSWNLRPDQENNNPYFIKETST